ncbi:MAG: hypothetical protein ACK5TK_15460 [Betaproteobacteria bacterium]
MSQKIIDIPLRDLVLWTENPRDPIDAKAKDQDVVKRAIVDSGARWNLAKLAKEMGSYYDYSELPTVVYHGKKPVVYDGNRRIVLGKIKHNLVSVDDFDIDIPEFPALIPCNVCSKDIALKNVFRKHAETGSWLPLERDTFLYKHMKLEKTHFLLMEENTGLISANSHLNQRFVKEEIFRDDILKQLGFSFSAGRLLSRLSAANAATVLDDLSRKIRDKVISTRSNRGKVLEILNPASQRLIDENKRSKPRPVDLASASPIAEPTEIENRRSRRTKARDEILFGEPLYLRIGPVSNLYRDIVDLHRFYLEHQQNLSAAFPSLIRMALRLLCEAAAKDCSQSLDQYIRARFSDAKATLNQDRKTTLSNQNVTESSIIQLLHTGAHNYSASSNMPQTLAMSLIIGAALVASHGKAENK